MGGHPAVAWSYQRDEEKIVSNQFHDSAGSSPRFNLDAKFKRLGNRGNNMQKSIKAHRLLEDTEIFNRLNVDPERFSRQVQFLLEVDKLKTVLRQTYLTDTSRRENSAEHSWHICIAALIFSEYARESDLNLSKVIQMLLVHDLIEIDAGDTYCYDEDANHGKQQRELLAADRIFKLLPEDQAVVLRSLWEEFETRQTEESRFAHALDRFQPFLHNYVTEGKSWQEHKIRHGQVRDRMRSVKRGSRVLWDCVEQMMDDAVERHYLGK
jgi:putative hydrolase of HD superfamily